MILQYERAFRHLRRVRQDAAVPRWSPERGRVMHDDALFYADHFVLLPCWVQVIVSDVPFAEVMATFERLPA